MFWVLLSPPYYVAPLSGPPYAGGITWPWHSGTGEHQSEGMPHVGETLSSYQGSTGDRIPTQQLLDSQLSGELCFWMSQNRVQPWALAAGSLDAGSSANTTAYKMEHPEHAAAGAFLLVCSGPYGSVVHTVSVSTGPRCRGGVPSATCYAPNCLQSDTGWEHPGRAKRNFFFFYCRTSQNLWLCFANI